MFTKILVALLIPLCTGLFADLTDKQGEVSLESMAKQFVALGSLVQTLSTQVQTLSTQVQNLTSQVKILNTKQDAVASFKAYLSNNKKFHLGSIIIFDTVENNVGSGYNPTSGVFHVPITGIYTFSLQIDTEGVGASDYAIYNQAFRESITSVLSLYDSSTMSITIHANKGDDIYVKKTYDKNDAPLRGGVWSQFSGHLLRAE